MNLAPGDAPQKSGSTNTGANQISPADGRPATTIVDALLQRASEKPDREIYRFEHSDGTVDRITAAELVRRTRAVAARIDTAGAAEIALVVHAPGLDFVTAFFGCIYSGRIAVPVEAPRNPRSMDRFLAIANDSGAECVLTSAGTLYQTWARSAGTRLPDHWKILDTATADSAGVGARRRADGIAYLQYTSGSTATPKGVVVTDANVISNVAAIDRSFAHTRDSVAVSWLPHFHDMGLVYGILAPLLLGFRSVLMAPGAFIQRPRRWLDAITRHRATHSGGPNFAYDLCTRKVGEDVRKEFDLSSWRVAFNGAEPVRAETLDAFAQAFSRCGFRRDVFFPAYGLAEATLKVTCREPEQPVTTAEVDAEALERGEVARAATRPRTLVGCGRAVDGTSVAIVDPVSMRRIGESEVGEIWVSGPGVAQGYWRRPDETIETFRAQLDEPDSGLFLRTGDLGFLRNGDLFVTGRRKDLIIIRGRNLYPQDVEATAASAHKALRGEVAAFAVEHEGAERLAVVVEIDRGRFAEANAAIDDVRRAIAETHEAQAWQVAVVKPGAIPKTSSGKVQRALCSSRLMAGDLELVAQSVLAGEQADEISAEPVPATPASVEQLEEFLSTEIRSLLRVKSVPRSVALTSLGMDSLAAVELQSRIEATLGIAMDAARLLSGATIAEVAGELAEAKVADRVIAECAPAEYAPASIDQERLWSLEQLGAGGEPLHICAAVELTGSLDVAALERAFAAVLQRQQALRTVFRREEGALRQHVLPAGAALRIEPTEIPDDVPVEEVIAQVCREPFHLSTGPLWRVRLWSLGPGEHILALVLHHIVSDAWSAGVVLRELAQLYDAEVSGRAPALAANGVAFTEYAAEQRRQFASGQFNADLAWWKERFESAKRIAWPVPKHPGTGRHPAGFSISAIEWDALRDFSRARETTRFVTLLAALLVLLERATGEQDLLVASPIANRESTETAAVVGFFAAPLLIRATLAACRTLEEAVVRARTAFLDSFAHRAVPFAHVAEMLRASGGPAPQVMFSVLDQPFNEMRLAGVTWKMLETAPPAGGFDLFVSVIESAHGARVVFGHNPQVIDEAAAQALSQSYAAIVRQLLSSPDLPMGAITLTADFERKAVDVRATRERTVVITSSFTAEPIGATLAFWLERLGIDARLEFAPFGNVFQQLLDPSSLLGMNTSGVNVVLLRVDDWAAGASSLDQDVDGFVNSIRSAATRAAVPLIVGLCPSASNDSASGVAHQRIARELAGVPGVHVITPGDVISLYPVDAIHDPHADTLATVPYTPEYFASLGTAIARRISLIGGYPYKVIAVDCDNTLWAGVCGEDGPTGVRFEAHNLALQHRLLECRAAGILLCLCSKNIEQDVWAVFANRPEMPLRREHFAACQINWEPKSRSLGALARQLGLGLDSFVFIDDNPIECAEVEAGYPEVLALCLPERHHEWPAILRHIWPFDSGPSTVEDRRRGELYREEAQRRQARSEAPTLSAFLESLRLDIRIAQAPGQIPRLAQLTQRTNQFNTTTIRRSEADVTQYIANGGECVAVEVSDRFGDYGLVGAVFARTEGDTLFIDSMMLSCRTLGRGVEHKMIAAAGSLAVGRGLRWLLVSFRESARNQPALRFLETLAGWRKEPVNGSVIYRMSAAEAAGVVYTPPSEQGDLLDDDVADRERRPAALSLGTRRTPWGMIASDLRSATSILNAVQERERRQATHGGGVLPRTPLERDLARIWADALGLEQVSVDADFFALGGHSLLAVQVLSRVREELRADLTLDIVFTGAFTIAELAKAIELNEIRRAGEEGEALLAEIESLSDEEVRALLEREEGSLSG